MASLVSFPGPAGAAGVKIELRGGFFSPSDQAFREIYGGGPAFGADLVLGLTKKLDLWMGGSYFHKKGGLSYTAEETAVKIRSIGWGIRYRYDRGRLSFYAGGGLNYMQFDEENTIGDVATSAIGPEARGGMYFRIMGRLSAGAFLSLTTRRIYPAQYKVNIGGTGGGLCLAYRLGKK